MATLKLKEKVIEKIRTIENDTLLNEVYEILNGGKVDSEIYHFNETQKISIKKAQNEFKNGEYYSNNEINDEFEKWIKK